jgi:hypothetical protein
MGNKFWASKEISILKYALERSQQENLYALARELNKTKLKNRTVRGIYSKLKELISKTEFTDETIEIDGVEYIAEIVSGYVHIALPDLRKVPLHIYLWEQEYGKVPSGFDIHHRNGNRLDNRLTNLVIIDSSEHKKLHSKSGHLPETSMMFYFLQSKGMWDDYIAFREQNKEVVLNAN